jgi:GntR family transcriptional regulator
VDKLSIQPVRPPRTLVAETTNNLRQAIREGTLAPGRELPTEPQLASQLGVSRGTLRQAIAALVQEGLLSRRQGLGTFVVRHTAQLRNVLNANSGVTDLIKSGGREPGTRVLRVSRTTADERVARLLDVEVGDPVVLVERTRTADDVPVAHTIDYLPVTRLEELGFPVGDLERLLQERESLYACLRAMGMAVHSAVCEVNVAAADKALADALQLRPATPLLVLSQTDYSANGVAMLFSDEFLAGPLTVQVLRTGPD